MPLAASGTPHTSFSHNEDIKKQMFHVPHAVNVQCSKMRIEAVPIRCNRMFTSMWAVASTS